MGKLFIFTCVYNGRKYINNLLESLLKQTSNNFVHYIYDDGSTDNIIPILNEYKNKAAKLDKPFDVIIERNPNNIGNLKSTKHCLDVMLSFHDCDFFGWVNADDVVSKEYVSTFTNSIQKHKRYDLFLAQYNTLTKKDDKWELLEHSFSVNKQSLQNGKNFPNVMHRYFAYGCFVASINFYKNNLKGQFNDSPFNKYCFNDKQLFFLYAFSNAKFYHISRKKTLYYFFKREDSISNVKKPTDYDINMIKVYENLIFPRYKIDLKLYIDITGVYHNILKHKNLTRSAIIQYLKNYFIYRKRNRLISCRIFDKSKILYAFLFLSLFKKHQKNVKK